MTRLRKIVCDPALMEDLCRAAFSGQGRFLTSIVGAWRELFLARVQRDGLRACPVPQAHGLTAAAFRDFLGADGKQCVELLYGGEDFLGVRRYLPSKRRHNPPIPTRLQLGSIYTIKASLDGGLTWQESNQLLLDDGHGWGYSCLSMVDKETVGIIYEGSTAHMTFQAIKLTDIVKTLK